MHLAVDAHLTIAEVHDVSDKIEKEIQERLPGTEAVIHLEPHDGSREAVDVEIVVKERGS